jgi:hypothetical protein
MREEEMSLFGRRNAKVRPNPKGALMSQRESGYRRKPLDQYETPAWVTRALIPHLPESIGKIWEPACGSGKRKPLDQYETRRELSIKTNAPPVFADGVFEALKSRSLS